MTMSERERTVIGFGRLAVRVVPWAPRAGQGRLLEDPRLESLTVVRPWAPHVIFVPVAAALVWTGLRLGVSPGAALALVLEGVALWSLTEYWIHRHLFHLVARRPAGLLLTYLIHGIHHAYPDDHRRLVMPPVVTVPLSLPIYLLFVAAGGPGAGAICFSGFILGYLWYDTMHYLFHTRCPHWKWLVALRKNHLRHHFHDKDRRFGVSSTVWDHVFRTR
jgi:sterol desaturase/sphingolipid hydroxylase (fatty acid hydroxylase superfamily)